MTKERIWDSLTSEERYDACLRMTIDGQSYSEIADALGAPSRNTVAGYVHRAKVKAGYEPPKRLTVAEKLAAIPKPPPVKIALPPPPPPPPKPVVKVELPKRKRIYLTNARPFECRWPLWGEKDPCPPVKQQFVCGEPTTKGSYCAVHAARCLRGKVRDTERSEDLRAKMRGSRSDLLFGTSL